MVLCSSGFNLVEILFVLVLCGGNWDDVYIFSVFRLPLEMHFAGGGGEDRMVGTHFHILAAMEFGAVLADYYGAGVYDFVAKSLHSEPLAC